MDELTRRKMLAAGAVGGASLATSAAAASFGNPDRPPQGAVNAKGTSGADEIPGPQSKPIMDQFGSSVSPPPTDDVALADWLAHTPPQMVAAHLNLPDSVIANLSKQSVGVVPA